jgi:succinate dehydrogenase / fumarate reductase, cytochrome b subunit
MNTPAASLFGIPEPMKTPTYSDFVLKRLHSLTGVIPLTFFIFFHFFANSFSTNGSEAFNTVVKQLRGLPFLLAIESGFLFAPFLFHMIYGTYIICTAKNNAGRMPFRRNWAYVAQRVTAIVVFVFIVYHVIGIRFIDAHGKDDVFTVMRDKFSNPFTYWWYVVGIACTSFHLANGLCTFMMTWGITTGQKAQRIAGFAMTALGILVFALGISAVNGFLANHSPSAKGTSHAAAPAAVSPPVAAQ